jgi:hypothetical protein
MLFWARNDNFRVPFQTHQLIINEDIRALAHFSNIEECANAMQS